MGWLSSAQVDKISEIWCLIRRTRTWLRKTWRMKMKETCASGKWCRHSRSGICARPRRTPSAFILSKIETPLSSHRMTSILIWTRLCRTRKWARRKIKAQHRSWTAGCPMCTSRATCWPTRRSYCSGTASPAVEAPVLASSRSLASLPSSRLIPSSSWTCRPWRVKRSTSTFQRISLARKW